MQILQNIHVHKIYYQLVVKELWQKMDSPQGRDLRSHTQPAVQIIWTLQIQKKCIQGHIPVHAIYMYAVLLIDFHICPI